MKDKDMIKLTSSDNITQYNVMLSSIIEIRKTNVSYLVLTESNTYQVNKKTFLKLM